MGGFGFFVAVHQVCNAGVLLQPVPFSPLQGEAAEQNPMGLASSGN